MEITLGNLTAQFITDPIAWKVWAPIGLVAECHPQDWCNDSVDFRSEEAGRVLLANLQEVYANFTSEGEMVKNDQGATKDVPDTSTEAPAPTTPEAADVAGDVSADEILAFIKELLDACEGASEAEPEIVEAIEELVVLHKQAVDQEVETLLAKAEADAAQGLDVTSQLSKIEELLHQEAAGLKPRPVRFRDGGTKKCDTCNKQENQHFVDANDIVPGVHCDKGTVFE